MVFWEELGEEDKYIQKERDKKNGQANSSIHNIHIDTSKPYYYLFHYPTPSTKHGDEENSTSYVATTSRVLLPN